MTLKWGTWIFVLIESLCNVPKGGYLHVHMYMHVQCVCGNKQLGLSIYRYSVGFGNRNGCTHSIAQLIGQIVVTYDLQTPRVKTLYYRSITVVVLCTHVGRVWHS